MVSCCSWLPNLKGFHLQDKTCLTVMQLQAPQYPLIGRISLPAQNIPRGLSERSRDPAHRGRGEGSMDRGINFQVVEGRG